MFFKRSNGEFRETDRVTRFKLIKSGKNWLRASTSNFGLLKVIRGQVEETIVAEVREDAASVKGLTSRGFIKGIVVATAVLGATTLVNTGHADEQGKDAVPTSALVSSAEVATGSESLSEQDSKESPVVGNESATEAKVTAATSTEVAEDVPAADDKAVLEQNASEAALLTKIADKYASNHQNSEQKAAISDAVAKVQSELSAGTNLTEATAQSYTDQRARLSKSVDDMMATLKAAGFEGNTTVNGAPAVYAQLAPISTEGNGSVATSPVISEPNGATIEDAAFNKAGYSLDPNADRYTFGVWQFLKTDQSTGKKTYFDYYATLSVDRSAIKGDLSVKPDVYLRIIKKSDGSEAFTRTIKAGESNISLPGYITDNNTDVTNTLTYTGANGTDPGNVTFSFVNPNLEYETLQIRDTNFPGNENEDKPNIQTSVPYATVNQTTHYKVVDSSKYTEGKLYTPTGNETDLASYTHTGLAGQQFTASNNRDIPGYKHVAATTDSTQKTSGILGKGVVGQKLVELQGGANHYYVKRISEIVDTEGSTVTKFYALDPSQVNNFTTSDIGTEDVSKYTLIYTSKVNKAGEEWKADETKVTKVNSKNGDYYLEVNETAGSKSLIITGWSSPTETDTYKQMDGTLHTYPRPFKGAPNPTLTPAGSGNNSYNVIAGKVPEIQAEGSVANDPTAPNGKVYTKLKGYASFSNNYSIPSNLKPSTDVNYYFVKSDVKGNVYVHYKDTEGKTIKPDVTDEKDQPVNKAYDTVVDNRPKEITFEGKTYELVPAGNYTVGEVDEQGHLKSSDPTTGVVAKEDKNVTYIYKLKVGEVVITYVDEKGKELQKPRQDTPNSPYETPYDTTEEGEKPNFIKAEDGKTYKIVPKGDYPVGKVDENGHLESSDPVTGKVTKPKSTITYVYKEVNGNVYVHYKDTEGKTIKEDVIDEKAQPVDKDYDTVKDNRPQEIEFEGNTYELVPAGNYTVGEVDDQGHLTSSDDTTGKVIEGDKNVTYVYKLKEKPKGEVVITYVDEKGKEIQKPRQDTPNSPYDTPYNTTEEGEKPNTIKSEDGKTYKIVPKGEYPVGKVDENGHLEKSDPVTGKVTKPKSTITYVYKEVNGNVYVHYVDTEGKTIKEDVIDEKAQPVDKDYDTVKDNRPQEIEFEGNTYELVPAGNYTVGEVDKDGHLKSTDSTTGKVIEGDKDVTYVYKLKEKPKGEVVITYVDEKGKEIQKPRQDTPNSPYDTPYNTTEEGEKPNTIKSEDGKTYKIVPKGDYPVGKVDENGHLESSDPVTGKVTKPKSTITYVYKEVNGNVYVHYVDTEGKTIKEDVTDEKAQPVDKDYDTVVDNRPQEIEFEGNTYELVPAGNYTVGEVDKDGHLKSTDSTTGKVIEGDKDVTYVYKLKEKPKGEVVITYVDEKGKEIQKPRQDTPNSPYDTPYNTTEEGEKPNTIKSEDGKTYKIVPKGDYPVGKVDENGHLESSDPVTGKVTKPKSTITYVYKEVNGNVYVHYVDTEGKTIKEDVTDEKAQPVDKDYDTVVDNRPQEIEFEGNTYELVPAGNYTVGEVDKDGHLKSTDSTTGKVIEGDKDVTYVYKLKEKPKGEVVITYMDEKGKEIQKPRQDTPNSPYDTPYNTTEEGEKPNTIKSEDGKTYKIVPKGDYPVGKVDENGHLESSDPVTGKVTKPKSTITYVYKEVNGNVYVHYVDTEGKTIKEDVTDEKAQPVDKDYDTVVDNRPQEIEFEGNTYELVPAGNYTVGEVDKDGHLKSTDSTTGKVIEGDKDVTYVYKLKEKPKGEVVITYVDEKGKEIQKPRQDTPNSPYDTPYNTTEEGEKPNTIKSEDGKTYKIVPKGDYPVGKVDENGHLESSDPVTGKVTKPKSTITYVYKEVNGNVYVHYVDTEGKTIKEDVTDEKAQPVDKDYDTVVDNRPQEIEFEGNTYELVPAGNYTVGEVDKDGHLKSTDSTTGKVIEGDKDVTYVYKLKETPDKPVEPTPDKPVEPTPDKPVEPTPDKPVEPTPDKPVEPTPDKPVEPTPDKPVEPTPDKPVEPTPDKPVEPTPDKPVEPTPDKPVEPTPDKPVEPTPDKPVEPTPDKPVEPTPDKPVEPTPDKPVEPTPDKPVEPTPDKPVEPTPDKPVEPTPDKPVEPTPDKPVEPTPDKPVEPTPDKPVEPTPDKPVEPTPDKPVEPTPDKPVEPTPDKPVEPTPDKPVEPTPDKPVEPTPDKPVEPTPDKPVEPTPDKPVEPTPDKPVEPTPDKPVEPTPDKPVEPTPDKPVEPTPDKPVEPTPDKPVEPTPDKPVEPTPDKPVEPTPDKPVEPTPDKPVEPTPDKPVEPTPDKPVEPTPDKPVEPTPDKPVEPTPDKPVEPTPDKPVEPTPDKPVEPTPDKPVEPTPDKPVEPTPDKPVEPTPDKPVEPTPDKPVEPTPDKPVEPTPDKPVEPTPDKPVEPTPDKPVEPTPDKPVEPTPDKPVEPTPDKPVEPTPDKPVEPTPDKPVEPTPDKPVEPTPDKPVEPTPDKPVEPTPGKPVDPTPGKPVDPTSAKGQLPNTGETTSAGSTVLGVVAGLVGLAALGRRKKEDEK